jgi:hypothetical protein
VGERWRDSYLPIVGVFFFRVGRVDGGSGSGATAAVSEGHQGWHHGAYRCCRCCLTADRVREKGVGVGSGSGGGVAAATAAVVVTVVLLPLLLLVG